MDTYCVLVVDEDDVLRRVITGVLQTEGYRVLSARRARDAQDLMHLYQVDLVLIDAGLPYREGLALMLDVQSRGEPIARVLLTDEDHVPDTMKAIGTGLAHGIVLKPVLTRDLVDTVLRMLSKYHPDDELLVPRHATTLQVYDVSRAV